MRYILLFIAICITTSCLLPTKHTEDPYIHDSSHSAMWNLTELDNSKFLVCSPDGEECTAVQGRYVDSGAVTSDQKGLNNLIDTL